ncbi:MAG: hypothetical protein DI565_13650 [Ancylobacter novellus]|uniref:Cytochrome c domain-containing protein n=1 Tax=Ancylobacter novellus TaxID=921 RepID=A0A2W5K8R2_ANCNO|nr:MAG: hypothetical protein DI565_13650 [Ancylobacter novellus]
MTAPPAAPAARGRRLGAVIAVAAATILMAAAVAVWPWAKGYALYHGYLSMPATIAGTGVALPASASRCVNCHEGSGGGRIGIAPLDGSTLAIGRRRSGGAMTVYDRESFCRMLRDGVDPSLVTVSRVMPRFALSDADCDALWRWTSGR